MTEKEMLEMLEEARVKSETKGVPIYAISNGEYVLYTPEGRAKNAMEKRGYWVVAIFEHGHRVEA